MDDIFDLDKLKQEQEDAKNKRDTFTALGTIAQGLSSTPTAYELLYGGKINRPDVAGTFNQLAKNVEDPTERQAKLFQAYKGAKEVEEYKKKDAEEALMKDPNSQTSKAYKAMAQKYGVPFDETTTAYDLRNQLDPKKMKEIEATSASNFDTQMKIHGADRAAQSREKALDRDFDMKKALMAQQTGAKQFDNLPKDQQELITGLSRKNADKIAIKNQIDAVISGWDNLSEDQKVAQGRQLLKTLNSTEGKDAIGAEEANRLGSKLEFAVGNFTNSNPTQFGRDLKGFKEQAELTSKGIGSAVTENQKLVDQAYGGRNGVSPLYQAAQDKPQTPKAPEKSLFAPLVPSAHANGNSSPHTTGKFYNAQRDETKFILSDGTSMIVKGRQ